MTFHIRTATSADVDAVVDSAAALFAEDGGQRDKHMDTTWPARHGRRHYSAAIDDEQALCLLAVSDAPDISVIGHLVGRLNRPDPMRPTATTATLESLRVAEEHRGTGAGTALNEEFVAWARDRGVNEATVQAYAANVQALTFYRSRGYEPQHVGLHMTLSR